MATGIKQRIGFAALAIASVLMVTSPALAASGLTVQGVTSSSNVVTVTVRNSSLLLCLGTVRAEATVSGVTSTVSTSVLLLPGQTATVKLKFSGIVSSLLSVGVYDDNSPF